MARLVGERLTASPGDGRLEDSCEQDSDEVNTVFGCSTHVADRRCDRFGSRNRLGNGNIVEGLADQRLGSIRGEQRGRADCPRAIRASAIRCPDSSRVTDAPTPTTAMSISFRGMKRR